MTTLVLLLASLFGPWIVVRMAPGIFGGRVSTRTAAKAGVSLFFLVTAAAHFLVTDTMTQMIPPSIPGRREIILLTGFFEIAGAIGIWIPRLARITGWALIAMLVGVLPSNIYGAFARVPLAGHDLGPVYLLLRVPFQFLLIAWVYWAVELSLPWRRATR